MTWALVFILKCLLFATPPHPLFSASSGSEAARRGSSSSSRGSSVAAHTPQADTVIEAKGANAKVKEGELDSPGNDLIMKSAFLSPTQMPDVAFLDVDELDAMLATLTAEEIQELAKVDPDVNITSWADLCLFPAGQKRSRQFEMRLRLLPPFHWLLGQSRPAEHA